MRLWTLHPRYMDRQGLLALWREGLLAQAVLRGQTKGYRHHPQLIRFQDQSASVAAIATYLAAVHEESLQRGYHFDIRLIQRGRVRTCILETQGQLFYEWKHLKLKLQNRSPDQFLKIQNIKEPNPHPLFEIISGDVRDWEKKKQNKGIGRTRQSGPIIPNVRP